ncbi:hypothetical protein QAD02_000963 [Eretmocerus hayati]|uniref:Uncharacterized protein n=1 Tax=Eretmocerus hayati TaxID=131215 RepID=A0ACC2NF42_9HYME|nr:hypothetical protein QAD02_000963 [Eretmocerus hayati]
MARCRSSGDYRDNCELPNLFLSTTYTLNRSSTKSICTGLRYDDGEFRQVVQIPSSHNPVTFDSIGWGNFKEQFEIIVNYFHNQQQFNRDIRKPIKLSLPSHDLTLDSRFGTKAVIIDERVTVCSKIDSTSPSKKPYITPPSVILQTTTFDGLYSQRHLIDIHLTTLESLLKGVNQLSQSIVKYLVYRIAEQGESSLELLKDFRKFKQYYVAHSDTICEYIHAKFPNSTDGLDTKHRNLFLAEISAFGLPIILKKLQDLLSNTWYNTALGALYPGTLPLERPSAFKPGALTATALRALTAATLTPKALTPTALTPGALTPGALTPGATWHLAP